MKDFIDIIQEKPGFVFVAGVDEDAIYKAEKELGLKFTKEYKKYLSEFGVASFEEHELTGICKSARLNVVNVTFNAREQNPNVDGDWYVVENLTIDNITIWQSPSGKIYQVAPNCKPDKIASSLKDYINQ